MARGGSHSDLYGRWCCLPPWSLVVTSVSLESPEPVQFTFNVAQSFAILFVSAAVMFCLTPLAHTACKTVSGYLRLQPCLLLCTKFLSQCSSMASSNLSSACRIYNAGAFCATPERSSSITSATKVIIRHKDTPGIPVAASLPELFIVGALCKSSSFINHSLFGKHPPIT